MATRTTGTIRLLLLVCLYGVPWLLADGSAHAQRKAGAARKRGKQAGKAVRKAPPQPVPPLEVPEHKPAEEARAPVKAEEERELRRGERVEFDGRLIEGQTAAAGAIYLFERLPSELRSMVTERKSYRREILETLYPSGVPPAAAQPDKGGR